MEIEGPVTVDMKRVQARKDEVSGASNRGLEKWLKGMENSILDVMYSRMPYTVIQRAVHIHPTVSELIPTLRGDLKPLSDSTAA